MRAPRENRGIFSWTNNGTLLGAESPRGARLDGHGVVRPLFVAQGELFSFAGLSSRQNSKSTSARGPHSVRPSCPSIRGHAIPFIHFIVSCTPVSGAIDLLYLISVIFC